MNDSGSQFHRWPGFPAHALIDALVDNVLPAIDNMIEEEAIRQPCQPQLLLLSLGSLG